MTGLVAARVVVVFERVDGSCNILSRLGRLGLEWLLCRGLALGEVAGARQDDNVAGGKVTPGKEIGVWCVRR